MRASLAFVEKQKAFSQPGQNWVEPLREWILDTQQAAFLSSSNNFSKIASFVQKIGTNPSVRDKSARFATPAASRLVAEQQRFLAPHAVRRGSFNV